MQFTDEEGKVWKWRGEYREPNCTDHFMAWDACTHGQILGPNCYNEGLGNRAIVYPVRPTHELREV